MSKATRILAVVHDDGRTARAGVGGRPNATLLEIAEGPHAGKRGPDTEIFDLVGPIEWDRSEVVSFETGQRRPAEVEQ